MRNTLAWFQRPQQTLEPQGSYADLQAASSFPPNPGLPSPSDFYQVGLGRASSRFSVQVLAQVPCNR